MSDGISRNVRLEFKQWSTGTQTMTNKGGYQDGKP